MAGKKKATTKRALKRAVLKARIKKQTRKGARTQLTLIGMLKYNPEVKKFMLKQVPGMTPQHYCDSVGNNESCQDRSIFKPQLEGG